MNCGARVESCGRKRSLDESSQTDDRADGPGATETHTGQNGSTKLENSKNLALLFESIENENKPQIRVWQQVKHDEKTEEVRRLSANPEEIFEVIAKAWQDIFRRWDKEVKPISPNLEEKLPTLVGHATKHGNG